MTAPNQPLLSNMVDFLYFDYVVDEINHSSIFMPLESVVLVQIDVFVGTESVP